MVSLANQVIAAARGRVAGSKLQLVGQREPGPAPSFHDHPDETAEAAAVAASIARLIKAGTPPSEIAVLYRVNAQSEIYEEALTEAGIAYQVRGGEGFFNRQEIKQGLLALHRAAERGAEGSLPDVVRSVLEPLGLTAEEPAGAKARDRWEALAALADLVDDEVAQRPQLELPELVAELRIRADSRHPPVVQGVTLASLHAAKGLEWTRCSSSDWPMGRYRSRMRWRTGRRVSASRKSADCSTLESPEPDYIWHSAGRCRGRRAGVRAASRRGSSTASHHRHASSRRRASPGATGACHPLPDLQQRVEDSGSRAAAPV